jgi:hypothetical protein
MALLDPAMDFAQLTSLLERQWDALINSHKMNIFHERVA